MSAGTAAVQPGSPGVGFHEYLRALSRDVAAAAPQDVDETVRLGLVGLLDVFAVDCASIVVVSRETGDARCALHAAVEGMSRPDATATPSAALAERIRSARPMRLTRISPAAHEDVAAAFGHPGATGMLRSCVLLPFEAHGILQGALVLGSARADAAWTGEIAARVGVVAGVLADGLARAHAQHASEERLAFERVIADFVATLVSVPAPAVIQELEGSLARLVTHLGVDRIGLGRFTGSGDLVRVCSAQRPGIPPMPAILDMPWFVEQLRQRRVVRLPDTATDLPMGARAEREYVGHVGLQSQLTIPLVSGGHVWGGIGFASFSRPRRWTDQEADRLGLAGEIAMRAFMRAQAQEDGERQRDELAHVARVAALGELTAALAHELNQPLMAIRANAQATRRMFRSAESVDVVEVLTDIADDATRAADLIRRLRDLLRRRELAREELDVNDVVIAVSGMARREVDRHGAELIVAVGTGLPPVLGDAIQLQQVVLNLVRNAAEAMSGRPGLRQVQMRTWGSEEHVTLAVEDTGPPIDDATLAGMFTPFSTTKPDGLGIGLAISRSIVEAHGGRLWAERRAGGGLAVSLSLPVHGRPNT